MPVLAAMVELGVGRSGSVVAYRGVWSPETADPGGRHDHQSHDINRGHEW